MDANKILCRMGKYSISRQLSLFNIIECGAEVSPLYFSRVRFLRHIGSIQSAFSLISFVKPDFTRTRS